MSQYLGRLPLTRIRIGLAKVMFWFLRPFIGSDRRVVSRGGIRYEIEPAEGFDFSIFLLGSFQDHVMTGATKALPQDAICIDIGANIGVFTLRLAQQFPRGEIHAFEPADLIFEKLKANLQLNPCLAKRIYPNKKFTSSVVSGKKDGKVYARWPLGLKKGEFRHPIHGGTAELATATPTTTVDDYVVEQKFERLDFIKIDTDGHELDVLKGAQRSLERFHPLIIFEVGGYLLKERGQCFTEFLKLFHSFNYCLTHSKTGKEIHEDNYSDIVPSSSTIDIIASPLKNSDI